MGEDATAELAARAAITQGLYRYCRALDRMDRPLADLVWHEGGTASYDGMFEGTGAEFLDWVWVQHQALVRHSHQITNVLVDVDGDRAVSEAYVTVALRTADPSSDSLVDIVSRGRYLDRWSQRHGRWAIDARRFLEDFQTVTVAADTGGLSGTPASARDRSDPSYAWLTGSAEASPFTG